MRIAAVLIVKCNALGVQQTNRILANPSSKRWKPLPVVELAQWLTTMGAQHGTPSVT